MSKLRQQKPELSPERIQELENFLRPLDLPKDDATLSSWIKKAAAMVAREPETLQKMRKEKDD